MSEWIKVSDQLPKEGRLVIFIEKSPRSWHKHVGYYHSGEWKDHINGLRLTANVVTHWCYLPDMPTEG